MAQRARKKTRRWPLYLIGASAAVAVWSGWVGLGEMSGFGVIHPLPGIWESFHLNTAITLPVGMEAYGAVALGAWMSPETPKAARKFARRSAFGSLGLGMLGQIAYHLLDALHETAAPWPIVMSVACLPVVTLGFAAALIHLLHLEHEEPVPAPEAPVPVPVPAVPAPAAVPAWQPAGALVPEPAPVQAAPVMHTQEMRAAPVQPPAPVQEAVQEPGQPVGTVSVRNPLTGSRLDNKVSYDERVRQTGSFPAVQ